MSRGREASGFPGVRCLGAAFVSAVCCRPSTVCRRSRSAIRDPRSVSSPQRTRNKPTGMVSGLRSRVLRFSPRRAQNGSLMFTRSGDWALGSGFPPVCSRSGEPETRDPGRETIGWSVAEPRGRSALSTASPERAVRFAKSERTTLTGFNTRSLALLPEGEPSGYSTSPFQGSGACAEPLRRRGAQPKDAELDSLLSNGNRLSCFHTPENPAESAHLVPRY